MSDRIVPTPYPDTEEDEPVEPTPGTQEDPERPDPFEDDSDEVQ
jgi:hypothetical protein